MSNLSKLIGGSINFPPNKLLIYIVISDNPRSNTL